MALTGLKLRHRIVGDRGLLKPPEPRLSPLSRILYILGEE